MQEYTRVYKSIQEYARVHKSMQEYARTHEECPTRICKGVQKYMKTCKEYTSIQTTVYKDMQECDLKVTYLVDFSVTDLKLVLSLFNSRLDLS